MTNHPGTDARYDLFLAVSYKAACEDAAYREALEAIVGEASGRGLKIYLAPQLEDWGAHRPPRPIAIVRDLSALRQAQTLILYLGGHSSDGALVEAGIAVGWRKELCIIRDETGASMGYLEGLIEGGHAQVVPLGSKAELNRMFDQIAGRRRTVTPSRPERSGWTRSSTLIMAATILGTLAVFWFAPSIGGVEQGGSVLTWAHWLGTVALTSTLMWSLFGLVSIYKGPHDLWDHKDDLGGTMFLLLALVCFFSLLTCLVGIVAIWLDYSHGHVACVLLAEVLFLVFDCLLIWRISKIKLQKTEDQTFLNWANEINGQIKAWMYYVDIPAVSAIFVLLVGISYLDRTHVLLGTYECELFSAGAVFFLLTAANLAFAFANSVMIAVPKRS